MVLIRLFHKEAKKHNWNAIERGDWHKPDWDGLHREGEDKL
jgi:hypothetical protein